MSLVVREGVGSLPKDILSQMTAYLMRVLSRVAVDSYLQHWAVERKEKIAKQFQEALCERADELGELEFDQSAQLTFEGFAWTAKEIAMLAGQEDNWSYIEAPLTQLIGNCWLQIDAQEHLAAVFAAYTNGDLWRS